ncbi:hypothetical protein L914_05707, partial [Phytophthora nicotianae]
AKKAERRCRILLLLFLASKKGTILLRLTYTIHSSRRGGAVELRALRQLRSTSLAAPRRVCDLAGKDAAICSPAKEMEVAAAVHAGIGSSGILSS